jgi:hypothetical protein
MSLDEIASTYHEVLPVLRSPFHVLSVFARDNRQRIIEAAEEKSLTSDADACAKARGDLTNPRNRMMAELAWLPGISPRRAQQLVEGLCNDPAGAFKADGLPPLASANLMASAVLALDPALPEREWVRCIVVLAKAVDSISAEAVLADINEDRTVAGFTEVRSVEAVEEGLAERRREYRECLRKALDTLPPQKLARVATEVAEIATEGGSKHPAGIIDDMIDAYSVGAHGFLSKEAENIELLIERTRRAASSGAAAAEPFLDRLEKVIRNWYSVAKPIMLVAGAKGMAHNLSRDVALSVRSLGIFLYNEHKMLEASQRIIRILREAFGSLPELAERMDGDARDLDVLATKKVNEEKIKLLQDLCTKAVEGIDGDPLAAEGEGRNVLNAGKKLIVSLTKDGLDRASLDDLENLLAVTAYRCAIALGNGSNKWEKPISLLEEAQALAHDKDIIGRIESNLATARENHRLFRDLKPVSSAPTLYTINGCGFTVYGSSDHDSASGSYITTYYFALLFLPIFPICRYRVRSSGNGYGFIGKAPLRTFDKAHLAASLVGLLVLLILSR